MRRVAANSRRFAYVYVSSRRPLVGSVAMVAHVNEAEFLAGTT